MSEVAATVGGVEQGGFRPSSRRRSRIGVGVLLVACAVAGNVLIYSMVNRSSAVLQLANNIEAGQQIAEADLVAVEINADSTRLTSVPATALNSVVGQYTRTYLPSGSLLTTQVLQPAPLLSPDGAIVAIEVSATRVPDGLRNRSLVTLHIKRADSPTPDAGRDGIDTTNGIDGRVVSRGDVETGGIMSISVEVAATEAEQLARADDVRIVLVEPGADPAVALQGTEITEVQEAAP